MKLLVIGDLDAVLGFSLVGVRGYEATTAEEANAALDAAEKDGDIGIVLITEGAADLVRERVDRLRLSSTCPIVVEIPGPEGPHPDRPPLHELIRRAIGISF